MKPRLTGSDRTARNIGDSIPWKNVAGATIPAYGVVQFRTSFADSKSQASKPNAGTGLFFANGPVDVASGKAGESLLWNRPRLVLLDADADVGDEVGPVADSWEMTLAGTGFRVIHQPVGGVGTVVQIGTGGGGGEILSFQIISSDPTTRSALVQIEQRNFTGEAYGSLAGDTVVYVYDTAGCRLNEPNVDLTARRGEAALMFVNEAAAALHWPDGYAPDKYWYVLGLCCPQVICEE